MKTVADLRALAAEARAPDRRARRSRREILRGKDPRRGCQPGEVQIPRQHEPRAAHAAQRHHRLFGDHGGRDVRAARRREIRRILQRHPPERPIPARRHQRHPRHVEDRGRPHPARPRASSRSSPSSTTPCAWSRRAPTTSSSRSPPTSAARSACIGRSAPAQADRAQPPVERGEVHARRRPHRRSTRARRRAGCGSRSPTPASASRRKRSPSSAGRSSRSKVSSPRAIRAPASALRSRSR